MPNELISVDHARFAEFFSYAPETGVITRLKPARYVGPVGHLVTQWGYLGFSFQNRTHYAHRVAWLLSTGTWPVHVIDHVNGNKSDNRLANLRDVPRLWNNQNIRRANVDSQSGVLGAKRHRGRWTAAIGFKGGSRYLGLFDTAQEAHTAYVAAKRVLHEGNTL